MSRSSAQESIALTPAEEADLAEVIARYFYDPYGFVLWAFPWGEPGTPLEDMDGPDDWQRDFLMDLGRGLLEGWDTVQISRASGHGVGKTALVAWIIIWFMVTRPYPQSVTTANTKEQLVNKTWRELAKWNKLSIVGALFSWAATSFRLKAHPDLWYAHAVPWSASNPEAFAGTHERYVLMVFDEASAIDDAIWEVTDGAMTTKGAIWVAFGNPTRNSGRFHDTFHPNSGWLSGRVNGEKAKMTNKSLFKKWEKLWGRDSDFYRVRVLGEHPEVGATQLISRAVLQAAKERTIPEYAISEGTPLIMGIDIGRQGDDPSVFRFRRGPKLYKNARRYRVPDLMKVAGYASYILTNGIKLDDGQLYKPDYAFVDAVGMGAGVYDRLIQLGHTNVFPVQAGDNAQDKKTYYNLRTEMWARMATWLETADIPSDDSGFEKECVAPEYYFNTRMQMQLEDKTDVKIRLGHSTDEADAVALTLAEVVGETSESGQGAMEPEQV